MTTSPATTAWCTERNHPWVTYNPWLDNTWCRCGTRVEPGQQPMDWEAKWELNHPPYNPHEFTRAAQ